MFPPLFGGQFGLIWKRLFIILHSNMKRETLFLLWLQMGTLFKPSPVHCRRITMNWDIGGTQRNSISCVLRDIAMSGAKITSLVLFIHWEGAGSEQHTDVDAAGTVILAHRSCLWFLACQKGTVGPGSSSFFKDSLDHYCKSHIYCKFIQGTVVRNSTSLKWLEERA